ncbi:helix-turn-helix domain-containing protein [Saccharopolyspora phatthalungensis]|uniref:Transcriptional regulator with XRE-family HTH domain n=1 Tax=Saccharopolyspora phatthalungensis TaxID=664693 RepID=A0A840QB59_9PSEU|nr:helix-turn-helix transcriptional regulator [Saccharopolyspora phatthalungensis]MBB5155675.1 transcriptional regulator with XRE-family HTH domain [Saccharopolyspora phatthalungensis]
MATPTVRRLQLGNELRHVRQKAGREQAEAAAALDCGIGKISRLELGQGGISKGDLKLLLEFYGVDPQEMQWMFELARTRSSRGRWGDYRAVFPEWFRMYVDLETDAENIRQVQGEIVPGILQTESYMRSLHTSSVRRDDEGVDALVSSRQERQQILTRDKPPTMSFILSESCLRRQIGNVWIMREQIDHLAEVALQTNIAIQVMPFTAETSTGGISYDFTLLQIPSHGIAADLEFVYIECFDDARYLDAKDAISAYTTLWNRLQAAALGPKESLDLIRSVGKQYSE